MFIVLWGFQYIWKNLQKLMTSGKSLSLFGLQGECKWDSTESTDTALIIHIYYKSLTYQQIKRKQRYRQQSVIAVEIDGGSNLNTI